MKKLKEKQLLVNFAKALGQEPDPKLLEEITFVENLKHKTVKSVKENSIFKPLDEEKKIEVLEGEEEWASKAIDEAEESLIDKTIKFISEAPKSKDSFQQPTPPAVPADLQAITGKLRQLEQWVGKISMAGPGSGEVKLRFLDDIDRSTIGPNKHLAYSNVTGKFFFEDVIAGSEVVGDGYTIDIDGPNGNVISVINLPANTAIGPVEQLSFNTNHTHEEERVPGTLCWDAGDGTLNISHMGNVVQQVGMESYMLAFNQTGNTILNGQCVRFSGATNGDGEARIAVAPFLADGTYPSLYAVGVATQDIENNGEGLITVFGKVRDIDTTGSSSGETWQKGDILYANTTSAGNLTKVKPTAPNNVVPIAAVLKANATVGELFVRPTIEQKMSYGVFTRTIDLEPTEVNTAYPVGLSNEEVSNGVTIGSPSSRLVVDQSGLYQIDITAHFDTTGGTFDEDTWYLWLRKNGTDVPNSMRRGGIDGELPNGLSVGFARVISLNADDYIEVCIAVSDVDVDLQAQPATAFGPSTAAMEVSVSQIQL